MLGKSFHAHRGDTLVETIIAFAIFSAVAIGALLIMNRGVALSQRSLEVTLVRQQIDSQADMLRYIRQSQSADWRAITSSTYVTTSPASLSSTGNTCQAPSDKSFFVLAAANTNPTIQKIASGVNYASPATYAQVDYAARKSYGIWVESTRAEGSSTKAYDFRIHACWQTVGTTIPVTMGTIVRLYDQV